jgi:hypothetical protein
MVGHLFISYARKDGAANAERVDRTLAGAGFATWRDTRGIDPTADFTAEIEKAIESATYLIACITPDVKRDDSFVRRELRRWCDRSLLTRASRSERRPYLH